MVISPKTKKNFAVRKMSENIKNHVSITGDTPKTRRRREKNVYFWSKSGKFPQDFLT